MLREQLRVWLTGSGMQASESVLNKLGPITAKVKVIFLRSRMGIAVTIALSDKCVLGCVARIR